MPKTKSKEKPTYVTINLPSNIIEAVQFLIDNEPDLFYYRTPAEFVIESARLRLLDFEETIRTKKQLDL